MKFFKRGEEKTYPYSDRMTELNRVSKIPYRSIKLRALTVFEKDEVALLESIPNQLIRSQALDSVRGKINAAQFQIRQETMGQANNAQPNPVARRLFFGAPMVNPFARQLFVDEVQTQTLQN